METIASLDSGLGTENDNNYSVYINIVDCLYTHLNKYMHIYCIET